MRKIRGIYFAIFSAGVASLTLELSLLREFVYVFGATAFSNSLIISMFLAGLACGVYLGTWKRIKAKNENQALLKFALIQFSVIIFVIIFYLTRKYFIYICPWHRVVILYFIASVLTPSLLSGLSYATSVEILYRKGEKSVTYIYAYSTLGSVFGGIMHGMFLVQFFGMKSTYIFAVIFSALALFAVYPFPKSLRSMAILLFAIIGILAIYFDCSNMFYKFDNLLFSKDSQFGPVEVWRLPNANVIDLKINRCHQAYSSDWDVRVHKQWAETTLEIINRPCNVLSLGYGSGVSSAAFLEYDLVKRVDTVENCLPIIEASSKFFAKEWEALKKDRRSNIFVQDFRNYARFTRLKYDIIMLDHSIIDPYYSGFFTLEFFDQLKKILNPNGVIVLLGEGLSLNTNRLSFRYIYKNTDPRKESYIRDGLLFFSMEKFDKRIAGNYKLLEEGQSANSPVYSDEQITYSAKIKNSLN